MPYFALLWWLDWPSFTKLKDNFIIIGRLPKSPSYPPPPPKSSKQLQNIPAPVNFAFQGLHLAKHSQEERRFATTHLTHNHCHLACTEQQTKVKLSTKSGWLIRCPRWTAWMVASYIFTLLAHNTDKMLRYGCVFPSELFLCTLQCQLLFYFLSYGVLRQFVHMSSYKLFTQKGRQTKKARQKALFVSGNKRMPCCIDCVGVFTILHAAFSRFGWEGPFRTGVQWQQQS